MSKNNLSGKLVSQIEIKSDGDVFHEIFRYRPHDISTMSSDKIHGCDLHDGEWGKVGSVICWTFTHDGKKKIAKEVIEAIDEENKTVKFKVIGGEPMEHYKVLNIIVHVDTRGINNLVTWSLEFERQNESIPEPQTLMQFCLDVTKDIETHHLK